MHFVNTQTTSPVSRATHEPNVCAKSTPYYGLKSRCDFFVNDGLGLCIVWVFFFLFNQRDGLLGLIISCCESGEMSNGKSAEGIPWIDSFSRPKQ